MNRFKKTAIYWWIFDTVLQSGILLMQVLTLPNFTQHLLNSNLGTWVLTVIGLLVTVWTDPTKHLKLYFGFVEILLLLYVFNTGFFVGQLVK